MNSKLHATCKNEEETADLLTDNERTDASLETTTNDEKETNDEAKTNDGIETNVEPQAHPVDTGWAWVILFAATLEIFIYGGLMRSYGIFFIQFQERFDSSASKTTLVQTVFNICISISGIIVMTIGMKHMSARTSICIGGVLTSGSYIVAAFTRHFEVLVLVLGAVAGITAAMIYLPILSYIGIYFNRRRGLANSISFAGASLGALVLGPLFTMMFEHYGYSGTMMLSAALLLNILVTGCLFRDPKFYIKRKRKSVNNYDKQLSNTTNETNENIDVSENVIFASGTACDHVDKQVDMNSSESTKKPPLIFRSLSVPASSVIPENENVYRDGYLTSVHDIPSLNKTLTDRNDRGRIRPSQRVDSKHDIPAGTEMESSPESKVAHDSAVALFTSTDVLHGSVIALNTSNIPCVDHVSNQSQESANTSKTKTCWSVVSSKAALIMSMVFDKTLLRDRVFLHFMFFSITAAPSGFLTAMYFVPLAKDVAISTEDIAILLFVAGGMDFASKMVAGVLVDRKILKPTSVIALANIIACVVNNMTRLISSFWHILAFVIIQAAMASVYISLYAVILVEHLGIAKFKGALGFTNMFHGGSVAVFFPLTGALRDVTGAYYWTYHVLSALMLSGAVLAFTLPLTHRRTRGKQTKDDVT